MTILDRIVPSATAASALFLALATATAHAQVTVVTMEGDAPPGAGGGLVALLDNPHQNGLGQVGFVGTLDNGDHFVWIDQEVVWLGSNETTYTLSLPSAQRYSMGFSNTGEWVYWPDANSSDAIWTNNGLLITRNDPAPDYTSGEGIIAIYRPTMLPTGEIFWVSNIDTDGDTGTEARAFYVSPDGTTANTIRILSTGDAINGLTLGTFGVDFDYSVSQNGGHYIIVVDFDGDTLTDGGVIMDGTLVVREGLTASGTGDSLDNFDIVTINNNGDYMISGDTDGDFTKDEFIVYNGAVAIREGDTIDGVTLVSSSGVDGLALNNVGAAAHAWTISGTDRLFYAPDASNLAASSTLILSEGDMLDVDGDGMGDYLITDFNTTSGSGGGVVLTDSGIIYLEIDIDTDNNGLGDAEAMLRIVPSACGDGVVAGTEQCDDGAETPYCNADCTFPYCGDGITNMAAGEGCDGGGVETPDCDIDCSLPECGDGIWNMQAGEVCDTGEESAECDLDCTAPECGDGVTNVTAGEECDDAGVNTETCDDDCTVPVCGDGVWNMAAGEDCDEGATGSVICDSDCTAPMCGDLVVNPATGEDCDEGAINTEVCDQDCTAATCGDGFPNLAAGEECDTAGATIECDDDCTRVSCGDGVVNEAIGEQCDDEGESATCNQNCTAARCGDAIINTAAGEECDDGNTLDGDSCSSTCRDANTAKNDGCSCAVGHAPEDAPLGSVIGFLLLGLGLLVSRRRRDRPGRAWACWQNVASKPEGKAERAPERSVQ